MRLPRLRVLVLVAMIVASLATVGWWIFGPPGVFVELTRRSWRMEIVVERLKPETGSDWCDELPPGAYDISRRVAADPTGRRAEPAEHCRYTALVWRRQWIARSEGGPETTPDWPRPPLRVAPPGQPGSERLGRREAYYEIELRDRKDRTWTCRVDLERWKQLRPGMRFRVPVDRFGTADCPRMYPSDL
ncbi:hypothetical protein LXT12_00370 [Pelomonas sp. P7]|uniref:Uncharacterized protein n=1 Tax=Pelomonas caseinilytica TaxID=2906763 RepID=A0ABS8XBB1_9BURK|nr:hypothetical protein [Pelomonas sp. P7]MCE4535716.1 hypothetical protein [Pelomonas sp. P7]